MNNQEALILGVQEWMTNNKDRIEQICYRAAKDSLDEILEIVGVQLATRVTHWMNKNTDTLVTGIVAQFSIEQLMKDPRMMKMLSKEPPGSNPPAVDDMGPDNG